MSVASRGASIANEPSVQIGLGTVVCAAAKKRERARGISAMGARYSVSPICLPHAIKLEQYTGGSVIVDARRGMRGMQDNPTYGV